jgi:hypothetical protein
MYQWDEPFVVDDRMFRARFSQFVPTSLDEGARETVAWALERFGRNAGVVQARAAAAGPRPG